jgi:hypothetical protein
MPNCHYCSQKCGFDYEVDIFFTEVTTYGQTKQPEIKTVFMCDEACDNAQRRILQRPRILDDIDKCLDFKAQEGVRVLLCPKEEKKEHMTYIIAMKTMTDFLSALLERSTDIAQRYAMAKKMIQESLVYQQYIDKFSVLFAAYFKVGLDFYSGWFPPPV